MKTLQAMNLDGGVTTLSYDAAWVCCVARRLLEQAGCQGKYTSNSHIPADLDTNITEGLSSIRRSQSLVTNCISHIFSSLWQRAANYRAAFGGDLSKLRFVYIGNEYCVEWVTGEGRVVQKQPFGRFAESILESMIKELYAYQEKFKRATHNHEEIINKVLRDFNPKLAEAVQLACRNRSCLGIHVGTSSDRRNVPLDVWMYVDSRPSPAGKGICTLSVHRAHRDFILGAANGDKYYFPPCLITARLSCTGAQPRVMVPTIRQPSAGYTWNHPYTGPLGPDPFTGAILDQEEVAVLYEPSKDALRLFPQLACRTNAAREQNLCLKGQPELIARLQARLQGGFAGFGKLDVLGMITSLLEFARLGITHGHQNNKAGPRAKLDPSAMPYPLRCCPIHGSLNKRIFVYNAVSCRESERSSSGRR